MNYKKSTLVSIAILMVMVGLTFILKTQQESLFKTIVPVDIEKISIEVMPETQEFTDKLEIDNLINNLQLEKWNEKESWDLELAPILFISFQEDEYIGLYSKEDNYAKIESEGKIEYYIIPEEVYDDIRQIYNKKIVDKLLDLPKEYSSEMAIKNGDVVIPPIGNVYNIEELQSFMESYHNQEPDIIRIISYTIEGDPIIKVIYYDGSKIDVYIDSTRDEFAGDYKGINKYTGNGIREEIDEVQYSEEEIVKYKRYIMKLDSNNEITLLSLKLDVMK